MDITALAYQHWLAVAKPDLPEDVRENPTVKRIIIAAFEQGYMAHDHRETVR